MRLQLSGGGISLAAPPVPEKVQKDSQTVFEYDDSPPKMKGRKNFTSDISEKS